MDCGCIRDNAKSEQAKCFVREWNIGDWEANGRPDEAGKERDAVEDVPILNFDRYRT